MQPSIPPVPRDRLAGGAAIEAAALAAPNLLIEPAAAAGGMAVSVGRINITPAIGTYMAGYATDNAPRVSTGVNDLPLYARCTVLWDNGFPNVIVTADVLAFGETMNRTIRARLAAIVPNSDLIITATHTHSGPVLIQRLDPYMAYNVGNLTSVRAYSDWLTDAIVGLVRDTLAGLRFACTLDYRVADENLVYNREGLSYVERDVPILVARDMSGHPRAVLFGWGCHPVSVGNGTMFDPDYPGKAISWIENATGAFAQFILGPAGDQNPTASRNQIGEDLGRTVINAMAIPGRPISGPIGTQYSNVALPLDITDTPANLAAVRAAYADRYQHSSLAWYRRHAAVMMGQIDAHSFAKSVDLPLQVWKFTGGTSLRLAFTGGELVSGYGVYFRNRYGGSDRIWVAGYANEVPAYIPSDELLRTGGSLHYSCGWDTDFPGIAGGAMTVYGWLGHFLGRAPGTSTNGVEQIIISGLTAML